MYTKLKSLVPNKSFVASLLAPAMCAGLLATSLAACTDREVARVDPRQNREQEKEIPVQINRNIDILFIVDDSGSMELEQTSLAENFSRFINVLNNIEGGLPNVHIGVISTDVGQGTHGYKLGGCTGNGDNGVLQNTESSGACTGPTDLFIKDVGNDDGVTRTQNYTGDLADTFSCIAELGTQGCGFEQPLESMRRALDGTNPQNAGFLRPEAFLAVIIITDEDDCSVDDTTMFSDDSAQENINSELGFLNSFRCFEFGVQCDPDTPRQAGPRQNCVTRENSNFMHEVSEYVTFLKSLKDDPGKIIVAGIIGNPAPVSVSINSDGEPTLDPSCESSSGSADPAVRIQAFLDAFPQRSTATTICNDDLSDALVIIADLLTKVLGNPCIEGKLALTDGQPTCTVVDILNLNQDGHQETVIAKCNADQSNLPCYHFEVDTMACSAFPTKLSLAIERGAADVPEPTTTVARCVAE